MTTNLHAHVATSSRDCDGGHGREYVYSLNQDEIAEHNAADGVNDFHDLHFKARVLGNIVSFNFSEGFDAEVHMTEHGFDYREPTEEGFTSTEVRWCVDEDCEEPKNSVYDEYAQAMGY